MILMALALALGPPPAQLAPRDPSSRFRPRIVDGRFDARKALDEFARCSIYSNAKLVRKMLLSSSFQFGPEARNVFSPDCLPDWLLGDDGGAFQMTQTVVRFAFADALFSRELANSDPAAVAAAPALAQIALDETLLAKQRSALRTVEERAAFDTGVQRYRREVEYYQLGDCVVRATPAEAKALLLTKIESVEESQAFAKIGPAIDQCRGTGSILSQNVADIRGTVALNYVRLAYAADSGVHRSSTAR